MNRTHNNGELRLENVGQTVELKGWVAKKRNLGALVFIDLRDRYGITQIIINEEMENISKDIKNEYILYVKGTVVERSSKNPNMPTGDIEVDASEIKIINTANTTPIIVADDTDALEETRMQYRYLDLRRPVMQNKILTRHKITRSIREYLDGHDFVDIETPYLNRSTPEGARDFLVPSRVHHGDFYALPQSPQLFKQLLMVSGIDKYFQIAPCFRDEDARADRAPGEFYQLDMEMSYATQEDVFEAIEPIMYNTFKTFSTKKIAKYPFPRIAYKEAMVKYGTDKPDLRNPLYIIDLSDFFKKCTFKPFIDRTVRAIKVKGHLSKGFHEKMLAYATSIGMGGLGYLEVQEDLSFKGPIDKFIPEEYKKELLELASLEKEDTIFFIADNEKRATELAGQIRTELGNRLNLIDKDVFQFCWIVDFPMFELDEHGKIAFSHNPFSMPQGGLEALEKQNPLDILAYQYDIVCNGIELSSGAVRNHDINIMLKAFEMAGYTEEEVKTKFGALYTAFQFGAPPHAGVAPGFDRMLMLLTDSESIREVIAFPLNSKAQDLMMGSPSNVKKEQLRDVHIALDIKEK